MSFYDNKWLKELKTRIVSCNVCKDSGSTEVEFEDTLFFPGGGGQGKDKGRIFLLGKDGTRIDTCLLKDIYEKNDTLIHLVSSKRKLEINQDVILELDLNNRIDGMQQHTGQHLLSGCFYHLYKANTRAIHIGKDISQLDIEGEFTDDMVKRLEDYANDKIAESINIKNYILKDKEEVNTRRPLPSTSGDIRILEIEGLDINACCGLHLDNTKDLSLIKIKKYYKHKSGTRFEYLAGKRAINYLLNRDRVLNSILNRYSSGEDNIINSLENIEKKKDEYHDRNVYLIDKLVKKDMIAYMGEAEINSKGLKIIRAKFDGEMSWYIEKLAKSLSESDEVLVLFANKKEDKYMINFMASKATIAQHGYIDLAKLIKKLSKDYPIKGGGSNFSVSGIYDSQKNIDFLLENVYNQYIGIL